MSKFSDPQELAKIIESNVSVETLEYPLTYEEELLTDILKEIRASNKVQDDMAFDIKVMKNNNDLTEDCLVESLGELSKTFNNIYDELRTLSFGIDNLVTLLRNKT